MGIPMSTLVVTMTYPNTAALLDAPIIPAKQYDRRKIETDPTTIILGGILNGKLSNLKNEQGRNTPSPEKLILL